MERIAFLIHGMCCTGTAWDNYRPLLAARGWRVIAPTLRHHAQELDAGTLKQLATTSLLDYVANLENEIRLLPTVPVVVGHSMGGLLALILAARGLASAAVLIAPAPPAGVWAVTPSTLSLALQRITDIGFWSQSIRPTWREARRVLYNEIPQDLARTLYDGLVSEFGRALFEIVAWPLDRRRASRVDPGQITCPVVIVAAGNDKVAPRSVCNRIAKKYAPDSPCTVFPGLGHWCLSGPGWQNVANYVVGSLENVSPAPSRETP